MATLLVALCVKYDRTDLIGFAMITGFALDLVLGYSLAKILRG